jgi:hypothetical protein
LDRYHCIIYKVSLICFAKMDFSEQFHIEKFIIAKQINDNMYLSMICTFSIWSYKRSYLLSNIMHVSFPSKHINDIMFIKESVMWRRLHQINIIFIYTFYLSACTKSGKWTILYLCFMGIDLVNDHVFVFYGYRFSERSCICVLWV